MIADDLRDRLRAAPFIPFTVITASGSSIPVHHHDYAWVLPTGGSLYVQDDRGKVHLIYIDHITEVVHEEAAAQASGPA